MKKILKISIPFPAWDGIFQVNSICGELRRNEMLKGIPVHRTPRRITLKFFDDIKVVEYWFTDGCYATANLRGHADESYGTSWELVTLRLRWKDHVLGLPMAEERLELRLDANQLKAIGLTSYLRSHLRDYEGHANLSLAQAHLAEAATISDAVIAEAAAPILAAYERQQIWVATIATQREEGRLSSPPLGQPTVEWKKEGSNA